MTTEDKIRLGLIALSVATTVALALYHPAQLPTPNAEAGGGAGL